MSWAEFPTLNSLRAFATVAENKSYSKAATLLNVSHAAVSQQVKALEDRMGLVLVVRDGRGIALTEDGAALARDLSTGFAAIRRGVEGLTGASATRPVQVTTTPAFAVSWLMPRIPEFQQEYPKVTLMLNPTAEVVELTPGGIDMAIRFGCGGWSGMEVTPLLLCDMVVVGARELIGARDVADPTLPCELPWLQELGTNEVAEWMERRGVTPNRSPVITYMPGNLIMEAVRRGDGLTYTARSFVERELESGNLVELSSEKDRGGYYIVTRPGVMRPPVRDLVNWLRSRAETATTERV